METNKLNAEQQSILLVGDKADIFDCGNNGCSDYSPGCLSADNGKCINSKVCKEEKKNMKTRKTAQNKRYLSCFDCCVDKLVEVFVNNLFLNLKTN